jgi:nucleotide-binding universal stress UspA family protein
MRRRVRRVVVGVSPSPSGLEALRFALREAESRQAPLYAVRAWYLNASMRGPEEQQWRAGMAAEALRTVYEAFDDAMGGMPADFDIEVVTAENRADLALLAVAGSSTDLLVLGGRAGWLMSWIVKHCLRKARCPVVVVPPPALARAVRRWSTVRGLVRDAQRHAGRP